MSGGIFKNKEWFNYKKLIKAKRGEGAYTYLNGIELEKAELKVGDEVIVIPKKYKIILEKVEDKEDGN